MERDRLVSVSATRLADLMDLVERALPTILDERLRDATAGALAAVRVEAVLDMVLEPA
jgi:hypothetical protein